MTVWDEAPIVVVVKAACPNCGSSDYKPVRGWTDTDGVRTSRRICRQCDRPYVVITETLPDSGVSGGDSW